MGHAALGICVSPPVGGTFLPSSLDGDPDSGVDLGIPEFGWCPDGLTEQVIDVLYGDLLPVSDVPDGPSGPPDGDVELPEPPDGPDDASGPSRLLALPARRISAGQSPVVGGEAA